MTGPAHGVEAVAEALEDLARTEHLLVALDFDGTLAPLVDEPMSARMLPEARAALDALLDTPQTTVALVSGRSLPDLREIAEHGDDSPILLAGSHGAERWTPETGAIAPEDDAAHRALRDRLRARAAELVADVPGTWVEPKSFGFGLHTRLTPPADEARAQALLDDLVHAEAPHWRRRTGHHIVEYAFRHEGKDSAIAELRERTGATAVLFAGDDVTDEDALRALHPGDLGVRVGKSADTAASVVVADIPAFADLLAGLARLRRTHAPHAPAAPRDGARE